MREPKLQYQDLKVKLYAAQRIKDRLVALVDEVGRDAFIASLRKSLEDIEAEARRRISELPDGTFRVNFFSDSTLARERPAEVPVRHHREGRRADHRLARCRAADHRTARSTPPSAPPSAAWARRSSGSSGRTCPAGISVMNPMEVLTDEGSCVNPGL